jgi:hypothetical protein
MPRAAATSNTFLHVSRYTCLEITTFLQRHFKMAVATLTLNKHETHFYRPLNFERFNRIGRLAMMG